jgi:hypothetical protein
MPGTTVPTDLRIPRGRAHVLDDPVGRGLDLRQALLEVLGPAVPGVGQVGATGGRVERAEQHHVVVPEPAQAARVRGGHRQDEVAVLAGPHLARAVTVTRRVAVLRQDAARATVDRVAVLLVAHARGVHDDPVGQACGGEPLAEHDLGHRGPADVAGADDHDGVGVRHPVMIACPAAPVRTCLPNAY